VSLHRIDPRFVLPHRVRRAVVLDGLDEWRAGLISAGIEVLDESRAGEPPDLVVGPAWLAAEARRVAARAVMLEGARERPFRRGDYHARRLLLRPRRDRPTLALPLDQPTAVSYALQRWSVVDRRWKAARMHGARILASRGLFPSWASPVLTVATRDAGPPVLIAAAAELGVPRDVNWFLTFGQGDALSRNAFQLFLPGSERPEWVLKFARVARYTDRFDNDERGLRLAEAAGDVIAPHAPRLVGRFDVDGLPASLETAAVGKRLRDLLSGPGDRASKVHLIERIAAWLTELGRSTQTTPEALAAERQRLRDEVVPRWIELGVPSSLVDEVPPLAAVMQHNDLGTWNVVAANGNFVVVDWENVREAALPLWDLLYFLGDAFVLLDGSDDPEHLPARIARLFAGEAPSSPLLFSWIRRAAAAASVPSNAVGVIATLCWLSHSLSVHEHNVDLATFTPRHPPRVHGFEGIGREWLTHPALGPRWTAWRD